MPDTSTMRSRVRIVATVDELLADAEQRQKWKNADSLSGSRLERVTIHGEAHVVKFVCVDEDWIMRGTGDLHCRQLSLLSSPVLDRLPCVIDHAIIAAAPFTSERGHRGAALLMRDVSSSMIPGDGTPIPLATHHRFLDHMAALHAAYMGFNDTFELFPLAHHYVFLTPTMAALESAAPPLQGVPAAVRGGWTAMQARRPREAASLLRLAADPTPLLEVLGRSPQTLVHADWKLGNLGAHADGRTVLLDWDRTGQGPPLVDLAWYLAVNCDRLPESKEAAITTYRGSLEAHGVATASWWDEQLGAALGGAFLQLGWAKTADDREFGWWSERLEAATLLT